MKFYNRYYTGSYEELLTYYPRFYRDVFEMVEILKAFGRVADGLEAGVERVFLNSFILTADAETVKEWEGILHITYAEQLTLDQRKRVVIGRLCGNGHIGEQEIREIIANYTGGAVGIDFKLGVIYITIEGEVFGEANLLDTLYRRVPAHLAIGMQVRTRRTFRQQLWVGYGGAIGTQQTGQFVAEPRTVRRALLVAHSGYLTPTLNGEPSDVRRASTGRRSGAGGVFFQTKIKSKLIKEESGNA